MANNAEKTAISEGTTFEQALKELEANALEFAREIERIDRKGKAALAQKEAELESCKLTLEVESKKHDRMKEQIKACKIYATQDGQVVYANTRDGRQSDQVLIEVGSSVRERQAIINLPDLDAMKVNAKAHANEIQHYQNMLDHNADQFFLEQAEYKAYRRGVTEVLQIMAQSGNVTKVG